MCRQLGAWPLRIKQQQLLQQCQLLIESSKLKAEQLQRYEQLKQKHLSKLA